MDDSGTNLNVICLESKAFQALANEMAMQFKKEFLGSLNPWIKEDAAMDLLRITSKTTFQKYRDEGKFKFSRITSKLILYERQSILDFIESKSTPKL